MELTISYFLKTAIVLLLLYLFYYGLLRNQTNFSLNRIYLLLAPLVAMVLPLLKWPVALAPETAVGEVLQSIQLSEVTVTAFRPASSPATVPYFSPATIALGFYVIGTLFVLLKLTKQLWQVQRIKTHTAALQASDEDVQVYQLPSHYPTFAFGRAVFISNQENLTSADQEKILAHERAHVQLWHTLDVLYYELITAFLWINPVVWLLKQELRDVHEYQADAKVLRSHRAQEYSALLSRQVLLQMGLPIGSYFQKPQVLKRLHMLQQNGHQSGWLRPLLILPLLGGLLFVFSLQQVDAQTQQELSLQNEQKQAEAKPALPVVLKDSEEEAGSSKERPFTYVEKMPSFKGGETEMLKYLAKSIRYPKDAQKDGVEGLVVVSFTVEDDGKLEDVQVLKSLTESMDAEAIRVVENMSDQWVPGLQNGKPVRVKYTLPIRFAIK